MLGGGQDEQSDEKPLADVPDVYAKFIETQTLAAAMRGGNVDALAAETADIDARASRIYSTIAKKAEAATLAKSAATTEWNEPLNGAALEKGERIERTRYPSGAVVCAVIDSRGVAVRTYREA